MCGRRYPPPSIGSVGTLPPCPGGAKCVRINPRVGTWGRVGCVMACCARVGSGGVCDGVCRACGCGSVPPLPPSPTSPYIITLKSPRRGYFKPKMPQNRLFLAQNHPKMPIFGPKLLKSSYFWAKSTKIVLFWPKIVLNRLILPQNVVKSCYFGPKLGVYADAPPAPNHVIYVKSVRTPTPLPTPKLAEMLYFGPKFPRQYSLYM